MEDSKVNGGDGQHWRILRKEICTRMVVPASHPSFVMYFILAVILIGPAGVWFELYQFTIAGPSRTADALLTSIATFSPALMASSCLQAIWERPLRSFQAFLIFLSSVCGIGWLIFVAAPLPKSYSIGLGLFLSVIALGVWWMSNANQKDLRDDISDAAAVGGDDLNGDLSGAGALHDFKY